jgi:hypothetical protein
MAIPPTPRADGDSNSVFSGKDNKDNLTKHEAMALEAAEVFATLGIINVEKHSTGVWLGGVSDLAGHGPLVQINGVLPFGGKEDLLNLLWSDRDVSQLGTKVWEVGDAEEGLGRANLHPCLGGIIFTDPLCRSIEVGVHDLNVSLLSASHKHKSVYNSSPLLEPLSEQNDIVQHSDMTILSSTNRRGSCLHE